MRSVDREVMAASRVYWQRCDELEGGTFGEELPQDKREELLYGYGRYIASALIAAVWEREERAGETR